jgi:hypothetical protein
MLLNPDVIAKEMDKLKKKGSRDYSLIYEVPLSDVVRLFQDNKFSCSKDEVNRLASDFSLIAHHYCCITSDNSLSNLMDSCEYLKKNKKIRITDLAWNDAIDEVKHQIKVLFG